MAETSIDRRRFLVGAAGKSVWCVLPLDPAGPGQRADALPDELDVDGLLDRFDSLLFTAPTIYFLLMLWS